MGLGKGRAPVQAGWPWPSGVECAMGMLSLRSSLNVGAQVWRDLECSMWQTDPKSRSPAQRSFKLPW